MIEPTGVTIHDPVTDKLLHEDEWTVLYHGQFRTLKLRVGRGYLTRTGFAENVESHRGRAGAGGAVGPAEGGG